MLGRSPVLKKELGSASYEKCLRKGWQMCLLEAVSGGGARDLVDEAT